MERAFEKSICLGTGVTYGFLLFFISLPNGLILVALYINPLRCFRKAFSVFLAFIAAVDLFNGVVACFGKVIMRFLCAFEEKKISQEGDIVTILEYIGINSSILLVTAMSVDRFISVVYPHFYLHKVSPRILVACNTIIVTFSSIFASIQLAGISIDIYLSIDIHLHTTFPLVTCISAYLGILFVLRKRSRVDLQRQATVPSNPTLHDMRRLRVAKIERKLVTTSFFILLFLLISLVPYFSAVLLEANCSGCRGQKWFFALRESTIAFLFINSIFNPFLTAYRINELKRSVKSVLGLMRQDRVNSSGDVLPPTSLRNVVPM